MHIFACIPSTPSIRAPRLQPSRVEGPQNASILCGPGAAIASGPHLLGRTLASSIPAPQPSKPPPPSPLSSLHPSLQGNHGRDTISEAITALLSHFQPGRRLASAPLAALSCYSHCFDLKWWIFLSFSFSSCSASPPSPSLSWLRLSEPGI